jgi:hypothetical protein
MEKLRAQLLVATGNFALVDMIEGRPVVAVKSMSRQFMRDEELTEFWDDAREFIVQHVLPKVSEATRLTIVQQLARFHS